MAPEPSYYPPDVARRRLVTAASFLVVAALAFGGALYWYAQGTGAPQDKAAPVTRPVADAPTEAQRALAERSYPEQVASQAMLEALADGELGWVEFGEASVAGDEATVPLRVGGGDAPTVAGTLTLARAGKGWSVVGVSRDGTEEPEAPVAFGEIPEDEALAVLAGIRSQEGTPSAAMGDLLAGRVGRVELGEPRRGPGTVSVPASYGDRSLELVLIQAGDHELLFASAIR